MKPAERPSSPFDPSVTSFVKEHLAEGGSLVVPMAVLWREYRRHCRLYGFQVIMADQFTEYFEADPRLRISEGRTGRAVNGVGFAPTVSSRRF